MMKYSLSYDTVYSVRLEVIGDKGLDTTVKVDRPTGTSVAVHFGASREGDDVREGVVSVDHAPTEDGPPVSFPAEPEFLRLAIYEGPVATGSSIIQRAGKSYLTVRSIFGLVDACEAAEGEEPILHPGVRFVEVFMRGERVAGAHVSALTRSAGLAARCMIYDVYSNMREQSLKAQETAAEVKEADLVKTMTPHIPLWAVKGSLPQADIIGEGPVKDKLTVRSEARVPYNARKFEASESYTTACAMSATEILAPQRVQAKYSNLDALVMRRVERNITNVVLGIGTTSGALAKSMPGSFTKHVRFVGVLKHGNADRVDNVILPEGVGYAQQDKVLEALLTHLGKPVEQVKVLAVFYEAFDDDVTNTDGDLKLGVNAKSRATAATGFIAGLDGRVPFFLRVEEPAAADLVAAWASHLYWPESFSLVHPFFYFARVPDGWAEGVSVGERVFTHLAGQFTEGRVIEAIVVRLRKGGGVGGEVEGWDYPLLNGEMGTGAALLHAFIAPDPNLAGQDLLTTFDLRRIGLRLDALHEMCKRSEPGYGFKTQGASSVPIEYFNATYASKYLWEVAGQQAPTHRALRVAPLSALFSILDDAVYHFVSLLAYVLFVTCAPMHSYELHQRVAALGFLTRHEALRRLRFEIKGAMEGSRGERVVSRARVTIRDAKAYAEKLLVFKDTYVTKKTWAVISAYSRLGDGRGSGPPSVASGQAEEIITSGALAALWQAPEAQVVGFATSPAARGQLGGRGRARMADRVYRGGRGRGGHTTRGA